MYEGTVKGGGCKGETSSEMHQHLNIGEGERGSKLGIESETFLLWPSPWEFL